MDGSPDLPRLEIKPLDRKFAKIVALMRSTSHEGERASARARAEALAGAAGLTLERAIAQLNYDEVRAANPNNPFAGMDEWMELKEPGHIDRMKSEKAERRRIWAEHRAALIKAYGSVDAIIAPCERETLILAAVKPWRKAQKSPYYRWTDTLDGWRDTLREKDMPAHVRIAIQRAYPMPTTFREAQAEANYWERRDEDLKHALSPDGTGLGDFALDFPCTLRWNMVRDLAEQDLPVDNLADLVARFEIYRANASNDADAENAIFRDLKAIAEAEQRRPSTSVQSVADRVADALRSGPTLSDREIARTVGCSPTTVGKIRAAVGLSTAKRTVHRRGRMYDMKVGGSAGG